MSPVDFEVDDEERRLKRIKDTRKGGLSHVSRRCGVKGVAPLGLPTNTRTAKLLWMSAATKENTETGAALARTAAPLPSFQSHTAKKSSRRGDVVSRGVGGRVALVNAASPLPPSSSSASASGLQAGDGQEDAPSDNEFNLI